MGSNDFYNDLASRGGTSNIQSTQDYGVVDQAALQSMSDFVSPAVTTPVIGSDSVLALSRREPASVIQPVQDPEYTSLFGTGTGSGRLRTWEEGGNFYTQDLYSSGLRFGQFSGASDGGINLDWRSTLTDAYGDRFDSNTMDLAQAYIADRPANQLTNPTTIRGLAAVLSGSDKPLPEHTNLATSMLNEIQASAKESALEDLVGNRTTIKPILGANFDPLPQTSLAAWDPKTGKVVKDFRFGQVISDEAAIQQNNAYGSFVAEARKNGYTVYIDNEGDHTKLIQPPAKAQPTQPNPADWTPKDYIGLTMGLGSLFLALLSREDAKKAEERRYKQEVLEGDFDGDGKLTANDIYLQRMGGAPSGFGNPSSGGGGGGGSSAAPVVTLTPKTV